MSPSCQSPGPNCSVFCLWNGLLSVPHINGIILYLFFCDWLILLSIIFSRFTYVEAFDRISLFFKAEYYSILCVDCILSVCSSIDGLLAGCWECVLWTQMSRYSSSPALALTFFFHFPAPASVFPPEWELSLAMYSAHVWAVKSVPPPLSTACRGLNALPSLPCLSGGKTADVCPHRLLAFLGGVGPQVPALLTCWCSILHWPPSLAQFPTLLFLLPGTTSPGNCYRLVAKSCPTLCPTFVACQAPLSM